MFWLLLAPADLFGQSATTTFFSINLLLLPATN